MAPKIIAVANTKGGVGKTTVALQIALARAIKGEDVWFVDGDRQQTGLMALTLRDSQNVRAKISCASYPNGVLLGRQVLQQADKWDVIVIDVGGYDSPQMRTALSVCDLLIIPFQPRTFDTWALSQMSILLDEVSVQRRSELPAYAILNCADPNNSSDNRDAAAALEDYPNIQYLDCPLCRRKAFSTASSFGLSVAELKTKDPKAIAEVNNLLTAIFGDEAELSLRGRPRKTGK
jgi:chromosome partitioning protein